MPATNVPAAEAVKLFKSQNITVQTAKRVKVTDKETGKVSEPFETKQVALAAEHILDAKRHDTGVVRIVTIDGKRYELTPANAQ